MKTNRRLWGRVYRILSVEIVLLCALLFLFPMYWILTGAFKTAQEINTNTPVWFPREWTSRNFQALMSGRSVYLFELEIGNTVFRGPRIPAALRWLGNTVLLSGAAMVLTCLTAAMAGYVLAKKRFYGRRLLFSLIVCAMALPKQVILIPLLRQMGSLNLHDSLWAVILPIVGWPFGVFLLKQFAQGIPTEILEACRIDGAGEWQTFRDIVLPMLRPGLGACGIFTFINTWNEYFMQLIMLTSTENMTISLGVATMQGEHTTDFGLLMAGSALASVPILTVFLIFQKYFTKGITLGAVKG